MIAHGEEKDGLEIRERVIWAVRQTLTQQTRGIHPLLFQCWDSVDNNVPTLKQHWVNAPTFALGGRRAYCTHQVAAGPAVSYKLRYIVGFGLVEMAISTNPKPTIYCNLHVREYGPKLLHGNQLFPSYTSTLQMLSGSSLLSMHFKLDLLA